MLHEWDRTLLCFPAVAVAELHDRHKGEGITSKTTAVHLSLVLLSLTSAPLLLRCC
jgi:hypothetical protein